MSSLSAAVGPLNYPAIRRDESVIDDLHGVKVTDPYRWLEHQEAEEVKEFVQQQVELTNSVLEKCEVNEKLRETITKLANFPRYDAPIKRGNKYFYVGNTGLQDQNVLYMQDGLEGTPEILLDPNTLSTDGSVALCNFFGVAVSEDAKLLAYALKYRGTDWTTIKVMRIEDKADQPDTLKWVRFSRAAWTRDNKGFFYSRFPAPISGDSNDTANLQNQYLCYHFLGTDQSEDIVCWNNTENPAYILRHTMTDDGKYLILRISEGAGEEGKVYCYDTLALPNGLESFKGTTEPLPFMKLIDSFDAKYVYVANDGTSFTFLTNKDAPKCKLARVDLTDPTSNWSDVVPESEKDVLESAVAFGTGSKVILSYVSDVKTVLHVRDLETGSFLCQLPIGIGAVSAVSGRRGDDVVFIDFTTFLTPCIIYWCEFVDDGVPEMKIFRETHLPGIERSEFNVDQVFVPSKDGTVKIPMFIIGKNNTVLDGSHPCLLFGYGGYGVNLMPSFSFGRMALARHLGVTFCIANTRGGGEYGVEWHKAGARANKQNVFDDFISCAEFLVSEGYTKPQLLCIEGGSNGGLLVNTCIVQRPDLYGCALVHGGISDMLRYHKFTVGHWWTAEFGCAENKEEFEWLIKYSPLHNVRRPWETYADKSVQYPPTMLVTADIDDRVVASHSFKFLATMQYVLCTSLEKSPQTNPIIARIERTVGGHGMGRPTYKMIQEAADRYSFMAKMLGLSWIA